MGPSVGPNQERTLRLDKPNPRVRGQSWVRVLDQGLDQVWVRVRDQVWHQVWDQVRDQLWYQVWDRIRREP